MQRTFDILAATLFAAWLLAPGVRMLLAPVETVSLAESRRLASWPGWRLPG